MTKKSEMKQIVFGLILRLPFLPIKIDGFFFFILFLIVFVRFRSVFYSTEKSIVSLANVHLLSFFMIAAKRLYTLKFTHEKKRFSLRCFFQSINRLIVDEIKGTNTFGAKINNLNCLSLSKFVCKSIVCVCVRRENKFCECGKHKTAQKTKKKKKSVFSYFHCCLFDCKCRKKKE